MLVARVLVLLVLASSATAEVVNVTAFHWSAGLNEPYVPWTNERRSAVLDALDDVDDDFIFLTDVWDYDDLYTIAQNKVATHPYSAAWHSMTGTPASDVDRCENVDVASLNTSMFEDCETELTELPTVIDTQAFLDCAYANFLIKLAWTASATNERCTVCYIRGLPVHGPQILDYCTTDASSVHLTTHSVMILSKFPLSNTDRLKLDYNARGLVYAQATTDLGTVGLGVTYIVGRGHLENNYTANEFYNSYVEENEGQMKDVVDRMLTHKNEVDMLVLAGNFFTSPEITAASIEEEYPNGYDYAYSQGFRSVMVEYGDPAQCTFCEDNNVNSESYDPRDQDLVSEHIFVRSLPADTNVTVSLHMTDDVTITVDSDPKTTKLSNRYATRALFEKEIKEETSAATSLPVSWVAVFVAVVLSLLPGF